MTWNYRVVKHTYKDGYEWYAIHEVYYDNGKPSMCSHDKVVPCGATIEELKADFANYAKALESPIIDEKEFQCDGKSE